MKNTIGIGLIGAGRAGMIHARNFASRVPHAKMTAVCDTVEENARHAAAELEIQAWYADWHAIVHNDAVDAVIVAAPTQFHAEIAVEAARAGKHIFCEKPMAMNREECLRMNEAADANKVNLHIGFMRRFDAGFRRAKELVDSGAIGQVVTVTSLTHGPSVPREWMYDIAGSNGPLAEVNSHDIDTLRWFTGSEAESLYAIAGNFRCADARIRYPDFYDTVLMNVRMKNGMLGNIDGAQGVRYGYDARVNIVGTEGHIQIGGLAENTTLLYTKDKQFRGDTVTSWTSLFAEAYVTEDCSFIDSIRNGKPPEVNGTDGMAAVDMVLAGNESIRTGQIVRL